MQQFFHDVILRLSLISEAYGQVADQDGPTEKDLSELEQRCAEVHFGQPERKHYRGPARKRNKTCWNPSKFLLFTPIIQVDLQIATVVCFYFVRTGLCTFFLHKTVFSEQLKN